MTNPIRAAVRRRIPTVEINPEDTPVSHLVDFRLAAPAGIVMRGIVDRSQAAGGVEGVADPEPRTA